MKILVALLVFIGLFSASYAAAEAADWVFLVETGDGSKEYYDKSGISRPSKDSVKVSTKLIPSAKQRKTIIEAGLKDELPASELQRLNYLQSVYIINCARSQFQVISISHYDADGKVIRTDETPEEMKYEWTQIPPKTVVDHLQSAVCSKQPRR